jgi:hypothetical protein
MAVENAGTFLLLSYELKFWKFSFTDLAYTAQLYKNDTSVAYWIIVSVFQKSGNTAGDI